MDSVCHWEVGCSEPKTYLIPRILGYAPWKPPRGFGAWLCQARKGLGLSRRRVARSVGMNVTTIDRLERGKGQPAAESVTRVRAFIAHPVAVRGS